MFIKAAKLSFYSDKIVFIVIAIFILLKMNILRIKWFNKRTINKNFFFLKYREDVRPL